MKLVVLIIWIVGIIDILCGGAMMLLAQSKKDLIAIFAGFAMIALSSGMIKIACNVYEETFHVEL